MSRDLEKAINIFWKALQRLGLVKQVGFNYVATVDLTRLEKRVEHLEAKLKELEGQK